MKIFIKKKIQLFTLESIKDGEVQSTKVSRHMGYAINYAQKSKNNTFNLYWNGWPEHTCLLGKRDKNGKVKWEIGKWWYEKTIGSKIFRSGDYVKHEDYPNRIWVVLEVTEKYFDEWHIDVPEPGLYAFGGMWYGDDPLDIENFGKVLPLSNKFSIIDNFLVSIDKLWS